MKYRIVMLIAALLALFAAWPEPFRLTVNNVPTHGLRARTTYDVFRDHNGEIELIAWKTDIERSATITFNRPLFTIVPLRWKPRMWRRASDNAQLLGTVHTTESGDIVDTPQRRYIWNAIR